MLRLKSIVSFIPTRDGERSRRFYEDVLGLRFVQDDGFAIVMDFNGAMVRIAKVGDYQPFPFTLLGWEVEDIAAAVKSLTGKGATIERYSFLEHDANGVWNAPGGAKVAWFKDPDGNLLSVSQHPPSRSALRPAGPAPARKTSMPKPAAAKPRASSVKRPAPKKPAR